MEDANSGSIPSLMTVSPTSPLLAIDDEAELPGTPLVCVVYGKSAIDENAPGPREHATFETNPGLETIIHCQDFDALLALLEQDLVDIIRFLPHVPRQEREYIERWARIFRPFVKCRCGMREAA